MVRRERRRSRLTLHGLRARKQSLGLLDFDDLLLYWRVAAQDGALGEELGAAYDHILVDEFQDVNLLQLDVLVGLRRMDLA